MKKEISLILVSIFLGVTLFLGATIDSPGVRSDANVTAFLNVTNTEPNLFNLFVDDVTLSPANQIDLTASSTREVICNGTVSDFNGFSDISAGTADARFFSTASSTFDSAADNNDHYRNTTCEEFYSVSGAPNNGTVICRFNVQYYANNETWECRLNFTDGGGTQLPDQLLNLSSNLSDEVTVNELLAMQVPQTSIDYGNLSVTQTSDIRIINVTNGGNIQTNITVRGFGGINETTGRGVAMVCQQNNISLGLHRYSNTSGAAFSSMINLTNESTVFGGIQMLQRTNDVTPTLAQDLNLTYWRIQVPLGVGGLCNGTIAFQASNEAFGTVV